MIGSGGDQEDVPEHLGDCGGVAAEALLIQLASKPGVFVPLPGEGGYLGAVVAIWNSPRAGLDRFSQRAAELLSVEAGRALERTRAADRLARDLGWHREAEASFRQERAFLRLLNTIAVAANEAGSVEGAQWIAEGSPGVKRPGGGSRGIGLS